MNTPLNSNDLFTKTWAGWELGQGPGAIFTVTVGVGLKLVTGQIEITIQCRSLPSWRLEKVQKWLG